MTSKILVISADTLTLLDGDTYFTGDLAAARAFVQRGHGTTERAIGDMVEVLIGYDLGPVDWEDCAEWGRASTAEMAWRLALGAHFGPLDDEFIPFSESVEVL